MKVYVDLSNEDKTNLQKGEPLTITITLVANQQGLSEVDVKSIAKGCIKKG